MTTLAAALCAVGVAHATSVGTAMSLNYGWPTNSGGNCSLGAIFDSGVTNWRNEVSSHTVSLGSNDYTIFWSELTDPTKGGQDNINENLDSKDLMLLATHGGILGTNENPTGASLALTTNSGEQGTVNCLASSHDMLLGDSQAEFVDIFGCGVGHLRLINGGYWAGKTPGLHQLHAFHGTMGVGTGTSTTLDDYLDDAFDGAAAVAWVQNETDFHHWSAGGADVCAIAMVNGNNSSDANNRIWGEFYDGGTSFGDPSNSYRKWTYVCGCESPDGLTGELSC